MRSFNFAGHSIRVVMLPAESWGFNASNEPWFVAADVCKALGLDDTNKACRHLGADEKQTVTRATTPNLFRGGRGTLRLIVISRPGLFSLISRSDKPQARKFQRWVNHDVLPSIMDHGGYLAGQETEAPEAAA